jgi:hypothetical protein
MQSSIDQVDPQGSDSSWYRVFRGGFHYSLAERCLSSYRSEKWLPFPSSSIGFRIVLELSEEEFLKYARQHRSS